jgi:hypothetical protein
MGNIKSQTFAIDQFLFLLNILRKLSQFLVALFVGEPCQLSTKHRPLRPVLFKNVSRFQNLCTNPIPMPRVSVPGATVRPE